MSKLWFLENVDLFQILCPHLFAEFKDKHSFKNYKKNEYVYTEGDSADKIFLVAGGKVRIGYRNEEGKEILKAIIGKGTIFGELAFLGENQRNEFAQVVDDNTILCPMSVDDLKAMMLQNKEFSLKIYKFISFRIKKIERRLDLVLFKDVKTRFLEFLREMKDEYGVEREAIVIIKHPYTQKDIADLIGASRQTVNELLQELNREGKITFKRGKIYVHSLI